MSPEDGDTVRTHYVGRKEDGEVFDTSREAVAREAGLHEDEDRDYDPLTVTLGEGQLIDGFESALYEMEVGETKTVTIPPSEAYGRRMTDRVIQYTREEFDEALADDKEPAVGMEIQSDEGFRGELIHVDDDVVRVDFNHDLAGETLEFEIELLEVV